MIQNLSMMCEADWIIRCRPRPVYLYYDQIELCDETSLVQKHKSKGNGSVEIESFHLYLIFIQLFIS